MATTVNTAGYPLLSVILFLPGIVALFVVALPIFIPNTFRNDLHVKLLAVVAALVDFGLALGVLVKFAILQNGAGAQWVFQFSDQRSWIGSLGISYMVGVDGVSVYLVALTTMMMAIAIIAATFMIQDRIKPFMLLMLALETGILGVFTSNNLFLFYVFWEAMLIPMYFLLGVWGEERRVYATMKFLIYTVFGSFLMLVGIFYLYVKAGTLNMTTPTGGGLLGYLHSHPLSSSEQILLFLAFGIAFAIKLPIFPFHTWAPTAYSESPVPVLIALAGILSKAGAFGFIRYCLPLFPQAAHDLAGMVSIFAIIGILYAAGLALVQTDIKRLVAYSSVSHMNLIALGIFSLNSTGLTGSTLQMINHSIIISGLFIAVALITARTGTRRLTEMGGMGVRWPVLMWVFFIFVLAGLDLPGLGSFFGEFLILAGVFRANAWFASIAALTVILAAWYMIRFFQDTMNGPVVTSPQQVAETTPDARHSVYEFPVLQRLVNADLLSREMILVAPLIVLTIYIGIRPSTVTSRISPTTSSEVYIVHHRAPGSSTGAIGGAR
ncbi:MAG TPA: NADH-quinone oxidoreductase subunit M [Chloroflexota bacterium]